MDKSISLIIPAYNEEKRISETIGSYYKFLKRKFSDFELIIVCNNCTDNTPALVKQLSKKLPKLKYLNFTHYTGKGGAVLEGFKKAKFELVGFVDADNSTIPEEFFKVVQGLNGFDVSIGSRGLKESVLVKKQPFHRRLMGKTFGLITRLLFGLGIKDTQCGAKVFKKKVIERILPLVKTKGFSFDVDLLWKASQNGFKINEVPIKWKDAEESKVGFLEPIKMFFQLIKLRFFEEKNLFFQSLVFFLFFAAVSMIISYWIGFLFLNSLLIFFLSLLPALYFVVRTKARKIPRIVIFASFCVLFLCAMPFLLIHPFYMASNDSLHTITLRVLQLNERIPASYEPYSGISFTYQFGFHLFAKIFADFFSIFLFPDYSVLWFLGIILACLQPILFFLFSSKLFNSKKTGIFTALLFVGTKTVYQDMLFGLFPRLLSSCFIFFALYLFLKKNQGFFLLAPAIIALHPGYAIAFFLILGLLHLFKFKKIQFRKTIAASLFAIPAILITYFIVAENIFFSNDIGAKTTPNHILPLLFSIWPWIGWLPSLVLFSAFAFFIIKKKTPSKLLLPLTLCIVSLFLFLTASYFGVFAANVFVFPLTIGVILFDSAFLNSLEFSFKRRQAFMLLILVFSFFSFFASSYLMEKSMGSKISPEEVEFAFKFYEFDPSPEKTLILSGGAAKIAELSNKALFNTENNFFLPKSTVKRNSAWKKRMENEKEFEKIVNEKCFECICDLNITYVVFEKGFVFDNSFSKKDALLEVNNIKLFKKDNLCSGIG